MLARTFSRMLNRSDESGYPCFVLDARGKVSSLSPLSMMLTVDFFVDAFYQVEEVPL